MKWWYLPFVLRTKIIISRNQDLNPSLVWVLHLQTQHSIQGTSCATTTFSPLGKVCVPMKILKPTFWHFAFGHMLCVCVCVCVPGLGCLQISNSLHGLTGKLTLPQMPTMQGSEMFTAQEYLHGSFKFFFPFLFSLTNEPTSHSKCATLSPNYQLLCEN
jgi:hypothetical protein